MRRSLSILVGVVALTLSAAACGGSGEPAVEAVGADRPTATELELPIEAALDDVVSGDSAEAATPISVAPPATVTVIGDSLTESAAEELEATLLGAGIDDVSIDGLTNRRMVRFADGVAPGLDAVADAVGRTDPDLWVIALGTNDVGGAASPDEFAADMRELLALLPAEAPVLWVDVYIRHMDAQSQAANAVIRDVLASRAGSSVVDWYALGDDAGVIADDGVHLTGDGRWIFARTITDAALALGA